MNLLITDATIVTCDNSRRIIDRGAIAIADNRIAGIGESEDLDRAYPGFERMSGRGLAVLPGFINAHTHTVLTSLRGTVEDWDGEVVYRYMSPISYTMSDHERSVMAALGCLEAIRSGTTTLVDPFRQRRDPLDRHVRGMAVLEDGRDIRSGGGRKRQPDFRDFEPRRDGGQLASPA